MMPKHCGFSVSRAQITEPTEAATNAESGTMNKWISILALHCSSRSPPLPGASGLTGWSASYDQWKNRAGDQAEQQRPCAITARTRHLPPRRR